MSTITLNSKAYPWANWTQSGLSRFAFAGLNAAGNSGLTFGVKTTGKTVDAQVTLSTPILASEDSPCGCVGSVLRTAFTTVRRQVSTTATLAERTDDLARLRSLVLTTQFSDWFLADTLPV